jgi:aspartate racemase
MKKLGLIGGTGPESTVVYYRAITSEVQKITGDFPELVIESLSVYRVLEYCKNEDYEGLASYLLEGVKHLAQAGADVACFTGITVHIVYDEVAKKAPIPILSMVDCAADYARDQDYKKVVLLGTYATMSGTFFKEAFKKQGIEVVTPNDEDMHYIDKKISSELEIGEIKEETSKHIAKIGKTLVRDSSAQAVILGCTELPLILNKRILMSPCMNVMQIHIAKLIQLILEQEEY